MTVGEEYWIWLQSALGAGARVSGMLNYYKDPAAIYDALCRRELDSLVEPSVRRRLSRSSPSQSYAVQKACAEGGYHIITPESPFYPAGFRHLDAMPLVLYVNGDPSLLVQPLAIGFVGTRNASVYGKRAAEQLSYSVAAAGAVVVSGCAMGIDSCCHYGALQAKGATIAYVGTGLDADYPKGNRSLRAAIAKHGAIVSEYPPGSVITKGNFPVRNRLIAASTLGVVVVEANEKSGALITAHYAMEYGKDVFAVPGEITSPAFTGGNRLIHDGAKPVFNAMDILEEYAYEYGAGLDLKKAQQASVTPQPLPVEQASKTAAQHPAKPAQAEGAAPARQVKSEKKTKKELPSYIDKSGRNIYDLIWSTGKAEVDWIAESLSLDIASVLSALVSLELAGVVQKGEGNQYLLT